MSVRRTALRYHGGKWKLAPWIMGYFPQHRVYVEPFGGGANVLLRKPRCYAEVYNDLNDDVVSFFKVLRHPKQAKRLVELLSLTPFSRLELEAAQKQPTPKDPVERARRTALRSLMGFGSASVICGHRTGFRSDCRRSGTTPAHDWMKYPPALVAIIERLQGVVIEQRAASACMRHHDGEETLHYVDPPYVHETRSFKRTRAKTVYTHEMTDADHEQLALTLHGLTGMVVLSGYRCPLYDGLYADWERHDRHAHADGARPRMESLWLNQAAAARQPHPELKAVNA